MSSKRGGGGKPTPRKSGFLVQELVPELASYYHLHTGSLGANHLDKVGDKIDLCIIDTVHAAPGEALDFLMVLPYLAPNAVIIIHDLAYHCLADKHHSICALLFHTLVGDKTIPPQYAPYENLFQNIGSCILSPNQSTHADLYFRLLHLPWVYMPNAEDLAVFKEHITKHYSREYLLAFEHILALQKTWQLSTPRRAARKVKRICKKCSIKSQHTRALANSKILAPESAIIPELFLAYSRISMPNKKIPAASRTSVKGSLSYIIACALACVSAALMLALVDSDHNWGGDFSQYIAQAKALIAGTIPTQIANNTLMMSLNDFPYGPNVYPWGYPLLLAPVLAIFGENLLALKCVNIALFSLFIICFYCYVARRFSMGASITLTLAFALNPMLLSFVSGNILSDIAYMCASFIAVVVLQAFVAPLEQASKLAASTMATNNSFNNSLGGGGIKV